MRQATVSAGYTRELMEFAVSQGANQIKLLRLSNLSLPELQDPDARLPMESYVALMAVSKKLCNDAALPLRLGAAQNFDKISIVGLMCYSAATMGEALNLLNRYGYLVAELDVPEPDNRFQLIFENDDLWLVDTRSNPNKFPELTEETWARFVSENRREFPDRPFAKSVHVPHPEPKHASEYKRVLNIPVVFNSTKNAILIDSHWPSLKLSAPNQYVLGLLSEHATKLLAKLQNSKTIAGQVECLLIPVLHKGNPGMEDIAQIMGMSRQTLYRKLKEEGIKYETLLDSLRHKMALNYLRDQNVSVNETAYLVGFSDVSAFSRAFVRWTGKRPGQL